MGGRKTQHSDLSKSRFRTEQNTLSWPHYPTIFKVVCAADSDCDGPQKHSKNVPRSNKLAAKLSANAEQSQGAIPANRIERPKFEQGTMRNQAPPFAYSMEPKNYQSRNSSWGSPLFLQWVYDCNQDTQRISTHLDRLVLWIGNYPCLVDNQAIALAKGACVYLLLFFLAGVLHFQAFLFLCILLAQDRVSRTLSTRTGRALRAERSRSHAELLRIEGQLSTEPHVARGIAPPQGTRHGALLRANVEREDDAQGRRPLGLRVGLRRRHGGHVTQPGGKEDQVPRPRRVEEGPAEGRAVSSRVAKPKLSSGFTGLGVEDAHVVLPHMSVRPMELPGPVHRGPVEDAVVQTHGGLLSQSRSDEIPPAEPLHDLAEPVVLRQRVHIRPAGVRIRQRHCGPKVRIHRSVEVSLRLKEPLLVVEERIVQGTRMLLIQLPVEVVSPRQARPDLVPEVSPAPHRLRGQLLVEGGGQPSTYILGEGHNLHVCGPEHVHAA